MPIDFNSEIAQLYVENVRIMHKHNRPVFWRPAIDESERKLAREVAIHVERSTFGYVAEDEGARPEDLCCHRCGATGVALRIIGATYTPHGRIDRYRCLAGCA